MGAYIYATKPSAVRTVTVKSNSGALCKVQVQMYEFAYKPWGCFDGDRNDRLHSRYVEPKHRAFKAKGARPLPFAVMAFKGKFSVGEPVFNSQQVVAFNDEDFDLSPIGTIAAIGNAKPLPAVERSVDAIVADRTAFRSLQDMADALGGYRPTIRCIAAQNRYLSPQAIAELTAMADAYDALQQGRGDPRRAFRG